MNSRREVFQSLLSGISRFPAAASVSSLLPRLLLSSVNRSAALSSLPAALRYLYNLEGTRGGQLKNREQRRGEREGGLEGKFAGRVRGKKRGKRK